MDNTIITIELEAEHIAWNNELNERKEELERFETLLAQITSLSNKKIIEHFQNQFFIQKNVIDQLKNDIKKHDLAIQREGKHPFDEVRIEDLNYHKSILQKVDTAVKIIDDLKKEFTAFVDSQ